MRRASGPLEGSVNFFIRKQTSHKNKSPNIVKAKSRNKIHHQGGSMHSILPRKTNAFSKAQQNQSSTFYTQNNKSKKSEGGSKKPKDLKKFEKQIMQVLHRSAALIQREWRKYLIRKYKKQIEKSKTKISKKKQPEFDTVSGRTSQCSQIYNNKKYYECQQSSLKKDQEGSFTKNVFSFNLSESKPVSKEKQVIQVKLPEIRTVVADIKQHSRTRSDQSKYLNQRPFIQAPRGQQKNLKIEPNILNVLIQVQKQAQQDVKVIVVKQPEQLKYEDHFIKSQKGTLDEVLKKLSVKLQQKKLKKILALENSFGSNLMTFRSYQKNVQCIAQEHDRKLTILQNKKKKLLAKFNQFVDLCKKNMQELKNDDQLSQTQQIKSIQAVDGENHHLEISFNEDVASGLNSRSMVLQEWDLDAHFSDKKLPVLSKYEHGAQKKEKQEQILIDDTQRQQTFIHQLNSYEKSEDQNKPNEIDQSTQKRQASFSTPSKNSNNLNNKVQDIKLLNSSVTKAQPQDVIIQKIQIQQQSPPQPEVVTAVKAQPDINKTQQISTGKGIRAQKQVEAELNKFHAINPNIDVVNNWLLEISHFVLDNFNNEFFRKLVNVEQPLALQIWQKCTVNEPVSKEYCSISQKIFKQFQFFHIKTLVADNKVGVDKKQAYSALMYTFHQALYDCLNHMLLDELSEGRNWINYPWSRQFKVKKLVGQDHAKQSLEKAINRVSNLSDYNIAPVDPIMQLGREFEHTQHNLIFAQEIKQIPLTCEIQRGNLIYLVSKLAQDQIAKQQCQILKLLFK